MTAGWSAIVSGLCVGTGFADSCVSPGGISMSPGKCSLLVSSRSLSLMVGWGWWLSLFSRG